ncbi:MAG: hypothetical protein PWP04_39 [Candidatus Atribacteria bacterium]|nr:hypothetical protein [Candidatus Atribacteria bacterium]
MKHSRTFSINLIVAVCLAFVLVFTFANVSAFAQSFQRIASFSTALNIPSSMDINSESSAEIITVTPDASMLIYSDSPLGGIGMIDISDPKNPQPAGFIKMGGEPTSVAMTGNNILVAVNTSEDYIHPSGYLSVVSASEKKEIERFDLNGQPDSIAVSPDGRFVAIAIENERDEDFNDGIIPQLPAGNLTLFAIENDLPVRSSKKIVDLTGLAEIAPTDPEPEFVDFNSNNQVVVTLQENNHIAIIDAETGEITSHFSAGSVDLVGLDNREEGALIFEASQKNRRREPDAAKWLDNERFVTANEGDYQGGSRGFTIFNTQGDVLYESGLAFEYACARAGHYPEKRSEDKGIEPEGLEVASFNGETYIFVLSERASIIGVYKDTGLAPEFVQLLPSGISPESAVKIPGTNLLASANESDLGPEGGVRSHVMIYELTSDEATYPQIESAMIDGKPIGWGALSGLAVHPFLPGMLYAVSDSFYSLQPTIFHIDASYTPARIVDVTRVNRSGYPAQKLDLEGITSDGEDGFYLASEGRPDRLIPHAIYHVDAKGTIQEEIPFPQELLEVSEQWAAEGITMIDNTLWIAIQRQWKDDPENTVRLVAYNLETGEWGAVRYPTESIESGWVGLSEITAFGDFVYIIERDNQIGDKAKIKRLYRVPTTELQPAGLSGDLPVVNKELVHDFIPDLLSTHGFVVDKIEGFAVDAAGQGFAVTDNDGVDDSSGETYFFTVDITR